MAMRIYLGIERKMSFYGVEGWEGGIDVWYCLP
jgi:hypothetical protein